MATSTSTAESTATPTPPKQHGVKGVYYGGDWLDIEDCDGVFTNIGAKCSNCRHDTPCPRSQSRNAAAADPNTVYDVVLIGAGCIGAAIARELSKFSLKVLWLEAADDVSQGATKGNSGIVHAGYDDKPGTNRAKYCWKGNQMFRQLDKELRFGYQTNGSLVVAFNDKDREHLEALVKRGETNGVERLRIVEQAELRKMEPHISRDAVAALYSPDAGNVIPYEYAIALAENAVDNGVELRIRRQVESITPTDTEMVLRVRHWEPSDYVNATSMKQPSSSSQQQLLMLRRGIVGVGLAQVIFMLYKSMNGEQLPWYDYSMLVAVAIVDGFWTKWEPLLKSYLSKQTTSNTPNDIVSLVEQAGLPMGQGGTPVKVEDMFVGGSGSSRIMQGVAVGQDEIVKAKCVINCAGGASDQVARMIGDDSFEIKPRLGDYLLLNRNQGHLARQTLFPCPDPVLGKGVLVQTTLWGNLILGPTARDVHNPEARDMTPAAVHEYILSKCKRLLMSDALFDAKETFHTFCGARSKSSGGDWIIECSAKDKRMIHVAGIDSPGLAGSPAIALEVMRLIQENVLTDQKPFPPNPTFNPNRAPIITPKQGMRGLKMGPVGKNDSDGRDEKVMASNVICKCEKVTELEVVEAMRRSIPIDSSQAIRKRTRAGMGHCQAAPDNYRCEARVRAIIARENGVPVSHVGIRPWPATSVLTQRWIDDDEKEALVQRMYPEKVEK